MPDGTAQHHDRVTDGYDVWVFGERRWFRRQDVAVSYARAASRYCPIEFIELRDVQTQRVLNWAKSTVGGLPDEPLSLG